MSIYRINYTDINKPPIFLNSGVLNSTILDITLIGMNVMEYGEEFDDNTLHILENFACPENPLTPGTPDFTQIFSPLLKQPTQGELWFNKTQNLLFVWSGTSWESLMMRENISGNSGIIVHGNQIPLPSGIISYQQCSWLVSPQYIDEQSNYIETYTDENAKVYARYRSLQTEELINGMANYIIIGIQNSHTDTIPFPLPSVPLAPSVTPTLSITPTLTPTISFTPSSTPAPGVTRTATPTITPTNTLTSTPLATITPTISFTPTKTSTPTPTPTVTVSVSPFITTFLLNAQLGSTFFPFAGNPIGYSTNGGAPDPSINFGSISPQIYKTSYIITQLFCYNQNFKIRITLANISSAPLQNAFNEMSFLTNPSNLYQFFTNNVYSFIPNSNLYAGYFTSTWTWDYQSMDIALTSAFINNNNYLINIQ